ncbi:MAG TPA: adenylate/guanylate cyclase domain-containing protein, partial [Actinomycetota bacterium]
MVTCPSCGAEHPDGFRFCPSCGAVIAEPGVAGGRDVRKTVTIVFCDVVGSTAMGETLDPEAVRRVMARYFDRMRTVLERHGATVEKFIDDAVMAVFGIPEVREDDALRAVRAAAEMREGLRELNKELERDFGVELESRIGVNTGEVVTGTGAGTLATGDAMNAAARLEQAAAPGEVLVGAVTYALVRDAVEAEPVPPISVRGKAEPVHAYRLAVVTGAHGVARRFDTPMVGRERELRMLREALDRAVSDRACVLFTLLGTAGVGKSRLIEEFLAGRNGVRVLRGRCLPYGDGITYWPVVEMLTQGAGLGGVASPQETRERLLELMPDERDSALVVDRLGQLLGLAGAEGVPDETHWAVRKLLEAMARQEPLVVDLDDLHFAEPALLDLVEHVSDWTRGAPILLVCSARHDLLDARPDWGGGKLNATTIALEPLSGEETEAVARNVAGGSLPPELATRVGEAAEGNPLFAEQFVGMLVDQGALAEGRAGTTAARIEVPGSIAALLEARIERLPEAERAVLERASIEGKLFHRGGILAMTPEDERGPSDRHVMALVRRDLVRPDEGLFPGEDAFRFRHLLIRDAAYARIPKERRAELHERFAEWMERVAGERAPEFEEIVGYHLEQAWRSRRDLGPLDDPGRSLGARAARHLSAAGSRAFARGDYAAASNLLERAVAATPDGTPGRAALQADLANALGDHGEHTRAVEVATEAIAAAEREGDRRAALLADLWSLFYGKFDARRGGPAIAGRIVADLERLGDAATTARALIIQGAFVMWDGRTTDAAEILQRAADLARDAGERGTELEALGVLALARAEGSTPVDEALARLEGVRERMGEAPRGLGFLYTAESTLLGLAGRVEEARERWELGHRMQEELGRRAAAAATTMHLADIELR